MMWQQLKTDRSGMILVTAIVITGLFLVVASGLAGIALLQLKLNKQQLIKHQALHLAEAGINYYRWHLAHVQNDFMDGTGADPGGGGAPYGPYEHGYTSPDGTISGRFALEITPPPVGSTIVVIKSTGWLDSDPKIKRSIKVRYGIPSLARYSILSNTDIRFGVGANVNGEVHSNGGVKMDGNNDSLVTSARTTWTCPSVFGCTLGSCVAPCSWAAGQCTCPGVTGGGSGKALWVWPALSISYNNFTSVLSSMRDKAIADSSRYKSGGSIKGYRVIFNADGTYTVRQVTSLQPAVSQWEDDWSGVPEYINLPEQYNANTLVGTYPAPAQGIIFIEGGTAWVEGTVKGRFTVAIGDFPDKQANSTQHIIINNNIVYAAKDGTNSLGLIAQKDVRVPRYAPNDLEIDAILLAQWGRVFYNKYQVPSLKGTITVYGGTITNLGRAWGWGGASTNDGFQNQVLTYDSSATFAPPPSFPTAGDYTLISWEED